jgi:hypothetical protein
MFNATASDDLSEWVELYNADDFEINLTGWNLIDNDGNRFSLSGSGSIPPNEYLVCHLAQLGTNDSSNVYGDITTTIILQPNATEGKETYLNLDSVTTNFGSETDVRVENSTSVFRSLIQFNISEINEEGLQIGKLFLFHHDGHPSSNGTIEIHRLNQPWTESGSNWNTSDGINNWTSPGGDYNSTIEYTSVVAADSYGWYSWNVINLIRGWKNGTYENNGLILIANSGSGWHLFYSSDYLGDPGLRPKLILEYNNNKKMLDDNDDLSLVDNYGNIVDYVAWGQDPSSDDDNAVIADQWLDGDYIDTQWLLEGHTLGRDRIGNDTDRKEDWQNASGFADDFGIDRGALWGPSPGEKNADPDLKGPRISDILSGPETQVLEGYINITCIVTDPDGVSNVWLNITLPDGGYYNTSMIKAADMNWYFNNNYTYLGLYSYRIWAKDIMENWSSSQVNQFEIVNRAPFLSSGLVTPAVGYFKSFFNFSVIYTDLDNHSPGNITVNITNLGVFQLIQMNKTDTIYSDGNLYYINISTIPAGTSYTFHFSANDIFGLWGNETPEIDSPDILPKSATLTAFNETTKYSDEAQLTAVLMENSVPVEGESIAFFIDVNDNGFYEASEQVGEANTLSDGSVSVISRTFLSPGTYSIAAGYNGSGNYYVNTSESILIINTKPVTLAAQSEVAEEGEATALSALLISEDGDLISNEQIAIYLDKNRNEIYEGSELIGLTKTSSTGIASLDYTVNLVPQQYKIWAKYSGSMNYEVTETEGILTVQNTGNNPPTILGRIPDQIMAEDSPPRTLSLTPYESDIEDFGSALNWYITGVNSTLYSVTGQNSSNDQLTFIPMENAFGNDEVVLWLADSSGAMVYQRLWINITPVNDLPYFDPVPPNLYVHFDDQTTELDDPDPWDFMFYVHDVETPVGNMVIHTSEPTVDAGGGYAEVIGLKITFHYPQSRIGETIMVTLTIFDGTASAQTIISVNITSNYSPELMTQLPDIILEENSTEYNILDLDDFFIDRDHDNLIYLSDFFNLNVNINVDNTVDITTLGHWTGSEIVTFRAMDPTGAIAEGYCMVTVIPKNDAPVISGVPDLVVHFDYFYAFDLSPYISDGDNLTSQLIVSTSESNDNIWLQLKNNLGIVINYPESMNGTALTVTIYVSDGIEVAFQEILITISNDFSPELLNELPDVSFNEDTVLKNAFLLSDYFYDPDKDNLVFSANGMFITTSINDNLSVDLPVPENWLGEEIIKFRATDPYGALVEDMILVVVVPINDPPKLHNIPDQEKNEGNQWILDLSHHITDVDNDISKLIINVKNEAGHDYVKLVGTILIFNYPNNLYKDIIEITVSDGQFNMSGIFNVSLKRSVSVTPTVGYTIPWPWLFMATTILFCGAFIIYKKKSSYHVYEAFLIHETGLALAYASKEKNQELEDVIVSGMFTAVQDFINDTLSGKTFDEWKLDEMKFGKGKILIEKSQNLFIAAIFEGNGNRLRKRIKKILIDINNRYGEILEDWDGDMIKLEGIEDRIMKLISTRERPISRDHDNLLEIEEERLEEEQITEETEEYICPLCECKIDIEDTECPNCGVHFESPMDSPNLPS